MGSYHKDYARSAQAIAEAVKSLPDASDETADEYINIAVFAPQVRVISETVSEISMHTLRFARTRFGAEDQVWWDWVLLEHRD